MRKFRLVIATFVAVAMLAVGGAACTPEQQTQAAMLPATLLAGLVEIIGFNLYFGFLNAACGNQTQTDCGP
jgi:hypothetical protein